MLCIVYYLPCQCKLVCALEKCVLYFVSSAASAVVIKYLMITTASLQTLQQWLCLSSLII